jgi:hypothetical protein
MLNLQFRSWDCDNPIKKQIKINYEDQFLNNLMLKDKIEKINKKG